MQSQQKEGKKIKAEINETENRKTTLKITMKQQMILFKSSTKLKFRLLTLRMKRGYTRDLRRYQKNNKKYYEQLFTYKFDNLDKMGQLLQSTNCYNSPSIK